jgi:hypothetical protein
MPAKQAFPFFAACAIVPVGTEELRVTRFSLGLPKRFRPIEVRGS